MMGLYGDTSPLCFCEYIDKDGERNHLLACCCNCGALDAAVDSAICCRKKKKSDWIGVLATLEDRMRIPWVGGAKQLTLDVILPILLLPLMFILSAQNPPCTAVVFVSIPVIIFQLHTSYLQYIPHNNFCIVWTYTSFALIFLIYEFEVVPFLEISPHENWCFVGLSITAAGCLYKVKSLNGSCSGLIDEEVGGSLVDETCISCGTRVPSRSGHCRICQTCIYKRELHCLWFGCCIGSHNLLWFILCLASLSGALIYSSSLTLTTVCRPVHFWGPVMLPEDCSEVYYELRYAVCFVSALYSLVISTLVLWALLRHCWMVTLGITGDEWRSMPQSQKCRLGITAHRPYSRGPICNWFDLLRCKYHQT